MRQIKKTLFNFAFLRKKSLLKKYYPGFCSSSVKVSRINYKNNLKNTSWSSGKFNLLFFDFSRFVPVYFYFLLNHSWKKWTEINLLESFYICGFFQSWEICIHSINPNKIFASTRKNCSSRQLSQTYNYKKQKKRHASLTNNKEFILQARKNLLKTKKESLQNKKRKRL